MTTKWLAGVRPREDVEIGLVDGTFGLAEETGREIIHQHPAVDGAAIGQTSMSDFRRMAGYLPEVDDVGFVLNVGSAVIMQRCFSRPSPWRGTSTQSRRGSLAPPTST